MMRAAPSLTSRGEEPANLRMLFLLTRSSQTL